MSVPESLQPDSEKLLFERLCMSKKDFDDLQHIRALMKYMLGYADAREVHNTLNRLENIQHGK